jgi:hypothetical protein
MFTGFSESSDDAICRPPLLTTAPLATPWREEEIKEPSTSWLGGNTQ